MLGHLSENVYSCITRTRLYFRSASLAAPALIALLAAAASSIACSPGDASPPDSAAVTNATTALPASIADATGTARIRLSGAQSGDFEGQASFAHDQGVTGQMALNLNLTTVVNGVVHQVSLARMGATLPAAGTYALVGIDEWAESGEETGSALASYAYGRGETAEALGQNVKNIIDVANASRGELILTTATANRLAGTLRFSAILEENGGEMTVEAQFDAPRVKSGV